MEREQLLENGLHTGAERVNLPVIREYMAEHYHEPLSIAQLAEMAGYIYGVDVRYWLDGDSLLYSNVIDDVLEIIVP